VEPDVTGWLQRLGLSKYAKAFEENEIDFDSLPYLSESMLIQIGMPVGPRAKVLAAVATLTPLAHDRPIDPSLTATSVGPPLAPRPAERRQITVMFCDLVDSTEYATRLDPEEFKSLMYAYQSACRAVVERYEGHIAQYHGDGVEVYFGWPAASEDSAERAVRAGLDVVEAVKAIAGPQRLSVRVGISTGVVVISETGHGDPSIPSSAVGNATYVAARLQALATSNSVIVAEATNRLISARFDREDLGPLKLKGIAEPVQAFRIQHIHEHSARFDAAPAVTLTPLVGRDAELALLRQRWRDANEGEGQIVYVSGVPGLGKSRIVYELEQGIEREPHFSFKFQCLPFHMQSAFFPVIQQLLRLSGLKAEDSDLIKLSKIERLLRRATRKFKSFTPFIANMLSVPTEPRYAPLEMTAVQVKVQILTVLVNLLVGLSGRRPVLCLVEDAQWIDPSTQELLDEVVGHIERSRILLVVTHRPEYQPALGAQGHVSALTISRLSRREVTEMTHLALRKQRVPNSVMQGIINKSDCIPLFVEELVRGVVEPPGAATRSGNDQKMDPLASWSVPVSLRDSLVARLDRAPQGRAVAQIAAVVGREFTYEMLLRVSSLSRPELDSTLSHLRQCDIVQQIESGPLTRYAFKHALLRDAAYESLLNSTRREIHAKVGAAIEERSPETIEEQPEILAHHYSMAGVAELAARYWLAGGRRARSRSANLEATIQFQKALEFVRLLPDAPESGTAELEIQLSLGLCSIAVHGYSSDSARESFERARKLSTDAGDPNKEIQAIFGLWGHYWMIARHDRAIELSEALLDRAKRLNDPIALTVGHRALGSTLYTLGDFLGARLELELAAAPKRVVAINAPSLSLSYAVDPRIAAQLVLAWDVWILGYPEQARRHALEGLDRAKEQDNPYSIAFGHYVTSAVHLLRGEVGDALEHADLGLEVSREHRINLYVLYSQFARGCALAMMGQKQQAMMDIRAGIEQARRINLGHMRGFMSGWLAVVQIQTGDPEAALCTLDDTLKLINDVSGRAWEGELRRVRGDALLALRPGAVEEPARSYEEAIEIASKQCARSFELRATMSLARLLRREGRWDEAHRRLDAVLSWFSEGLETADLMNAQALRQALVSPSQLDAAGS
jgi:class 3 adenylate cyclase/tetratricopeptide (TPR) repeat protein